jgi:hypothetical protein
MSQGKHVEGLRSTVECQGSLVLQQHGSKLVGGGVALDDEDLGEVRQGQHGGRDGNLTRGFGYPSDI